MRKEKDDFFKFHPQSPIPPNQRKRFEGLDYYPVDTTLVFEAELHEHANKEIISIGDNLGKEQKYFRWGYFQFEINGDKVTLQVYKRDPKESHLWLPFKDQTNGKETYGAGRYMDLDEHNKTNGKWVIDFNFAYNPFCAYNENYVCPFIPPENWLQIKIQVGEKNFSFK